VEAKWLKNPCPLLFLRFYLSQELGVQIQSGELCRWPLEGRDAEKRIQETVAFVEGVVESGKLDKR
jgi:hypothetical protein